MVCAGVVGAVGVGYNQYSKAAKEQVVEEATDLLNDLDSTFPDFAKTTTEEAVNKELLMDQLLFFSNEVPIDKVIELQQHLHPGHLACLSIFFGTIFC